MKAIVKTVAIPTLLDADALQPEVIKAARPPLVLTPHAGEFIRIAGKADLRTFVVKSGAAVVKKGPVTEVALGGASPGAGSGQLLVYHSFFGGPVLARGGSGDVLAGLVGGLLAQTPDDRLLAACRGVVWHGLAADALARARGQVAVTTTQLLDYLPAVLRGQL
jgi:NAD(P)H-hydrate epimerase